MNLFADRMATLGTENAFQVGADIAKAEAEGMDVIRFNLGEPDFDTPEFICKVVLRPVFLNFVKLWQTTFQKPGVFR